MRNILLRHQKRYPDITIQDYLKLLYQSSQGANHIIKSIDNAANYLNQEISNLDLNYSNHLLYEYISNDTVRLNLIPYMKYFNDVNYLLDIFLSSAKSLKSSSIAFKFHLSLLEEMILEKEIIIKNSTVNENLSFIEKYKNDGFKVLSHSDIYHLKYDPHYRLISKDYLTLEMKKRQLQLFIDNLPKKDLTVIAVEGKCCSGKTSITENLDNITVIKADDFFLNDELKKVQTEIGDFIDYKLLENEILKNLKANTTLFYKAYDCSKKDYYTKEVKLNNILIIEGVYSYNQQLRKYYDYLVYVDVNDEEQLKRLKERTKSSKLYDLFINDFIPRENQYYNKFEIKNDADLII